MKPFLSGEYQIINIKQMTTIYSGKVHRRMSLKPLDERSWEYKILTWSHSIKHVIKGKMYLYH
jgi:hypothetical protein